MRTPSNVIVLSLLLWCAGSAARAAEPMRVVASTEDLAAIARAVGGERIEAESIARGTQDPHFVELLPSHMVRVRTARVYLRVGMGLDYWAQQIIDGSRNRALVVVDCSAALPPERRLEVPTQKVDASMGDVHPMGNPHYWLDPENGGRIAHAIRDGLVQADPAGAATYDANLGRFEEQLAAKMTEWRAAAAALRGVRIITYHNSWPYFAKAFGIEVVDYLEPKPGVKPSPAHLARLIERVAASKVRLVAFEPYFERRTPELIARETGIPVIVLPPSVGGVPEVRDYFQLFDYNLAALARAAAAE